MDYENDTGTWIKYSLFPGENEPFIPAEDRVQREFNMNNAINLSTDQDIRQNENNSTPVSLRQNENNSVPVSSSDVSHHKLTCPKCNKVFSRNDNLQRHIRTVKCEKTHICKTCAQQFSSKWRLERHAKSRHSNLCPVCAKIFNNKGNLAQHARRHLKDDFLTVPQANKLRKLAGVSTVLTGPVNKDSATDTVAMPLNEQQGTVSPSNSDDNNRTNSNIPHFQQTFRNVNGNAGVIITIKPTGIERHSMISLFSGRREQFRWNLSQYFKRFSSLKWYMAVKTVMKRYDADGNLRDEDRPTFWSKSKVLLSTEGIEEQIDQAYFKVNASLENYCATSSGWVLDEILHVDHTILRYRPLGGSCGDFKFTPELLRRGLVSVTGRPYQSRDCFIWAVIFAIHTPQDFCGHYVHWSELQQHRKLFKLTTSMNESTSVTIAQIPEFEILNRVSVNVFALEECVFPLYVSEMDGSRGHADLLLIHTEDDHNDEGVCKHYCAITDIGRLVHRQLSDCGQKKHVCRRCLAIKYSEEDLLKHSELYKNTSPMNVTMPSIEKKFLRFKNFHLQLEAPFFIVARFESFRMPIYDLDEPTEGVVVRERIHRPCGFSYYRVSVGDSFPSEPVVFVHTDPDVVMTEFLRRIHGEQQFAMAAMEAVQPVIYCDEGLSNLASSNEKCHICDEPFVNGDKIVIDHCHLSSKIRGRAHNACNLNFRLPKNIVVLMHDLAAYDGRIVIAAADLHGASKISVVPKTIDTYVGITIDKCRFIDMQNFIKGSLNDIVQDLWEEGGAEVFTHTSTYWPTSLKLSAPYKRIPLCRDYINGPEKLIETSFPSLAAFTDRKNDTQLNLSQYQVAQEAWRSLENQTMEEYIKHVLITDCLLTSDIVHHFRETVRSQLKLDPFRYYSMASFAFDSALSLSEVTLELLLDQEMHLMIENAIRGGLAVVGMPRLARANNADMPTDTYDVTDEESRIEFLDFNGLYTCTMATSRLPTIGYRWVTENELADLDVTSIPADADKGFTLEVDLMYPEDIHDAHDDFPLAPEHLHIKKEDLSEYTKQIAKSCGVDLDNMSSERRLCLTLRNKVKYTLHYRTLQFCLSHGLVLTKIHRAITFTQIPFLETFMTFCGDQRKAANSKFYRSVWKNIAYLVSGKSYENPRNYSDVKICTTEESLMKYVRRPTFQCLRALGDNLTAVQLHRQSVELSKPISVGFAILELSKLKVYEFYYDFVKAKLARGGHCQFLAGDTDSLVLKITGVPDFNERLQKNKHLFDFSNFPDNHPMKNEENRMVPGKVKFELPGHVCLEFVALTPKAYSMKTDKGFKQARKGCPRELRHELYKECLLTGSSHVANVNETRNYGQQLYDVSIRKKVLNVLDIKRHHYNAIESVSFGHYSLHNEQE